MTRRKLRPSDLVLRCMAFQRNGYWVAMCVDLDLAVQADTPLKARHLLSEQIRSYVQDAFSVDSEHAPYLIARKAPLRYRAMYRAAKLMHHAKRWLSYEAAMPVAFAKA